MGSGEVAIVALSTMISLKVTFSDGLGGVNCSALNGNLLVLQKYSQKYSVANVSKRQTTQKVQFHTYHPRHSTMAWMDLSATRAA